MRPAGLDNICRLARADGVEDGELGLDEGASLVRARLRVEEGVDVGRNDVDGATQRSALLLPDVKRLGRGDRAGVAGVGECPLAAADEAGEVADGEVLVEEGLVANDDQLDKVPLAPGDDLRDLGLGAGDAGGFDEDAQDELEAYGSRGGTNIFETRAVGAVDADCGKAEGLNGSDVGRDGAGILAVSASSVGGVGDGPQRTSWGDSGVSAATA